MEAQKVENTTTKYKNTQKYHFNEKSNGRLSVALFGYLHCRRGGKLLQNKL